MKGINVNDNSALGREADVMGAKALESGSLGRQESDDVDQRSVAPAADVLQPKLDPGVAV